LPDCEGRELLLLLLLPLLLLGGAQHVWLARFEGGYKMNRFLQHSTNGLPSAAVVVTKEREPERSRLNALAQVHSSQFDIQGYIPGH
jgi:hypothetical protein